MSAKCTLLLSAPGHSSICDQQSCNLNSAVVLKALQPDLASLVRAKYAHPQQTPTTNNIRHSVTNSEPYPIPNRNSFRGKNLQSNLCNSTGCAASVHQKQTLFTSCTLLPPFRVYCASTVPLEPSTESHLHRMSRGAI